MSRTTMRALLRDQRGAVTMAPVYVIVSVIIMATLVAALFTATTALSRSAAQNDMASASRGAITAMQAELNSKTPNQIAGELNTLGPRYKPGAAISAPDEKIIYHSVTVDPGRMKVTFTVESSSSFAPDRTYTVEYRSTLLVQSGGTWVTAAPGQAPQRTYWEPVRTTLGGTS